MMRVSIKMLCGFAMAGLAGCASVTSGPNQDVSFDSDPTGAFCEAYYGEQLAFVIGKTPRDASIPKSNRDLTIVCNKDGYAEARYDVPSEFNPAVAGNLILGGLVGVAVDVASGAGTRYESDITVRLTPLSN